MNWIRQYLDRTFVERSVGKVFGDIQALSTDKTPGDELLQLVMAYKGRHGYDLIATNMLGKSEEDRLNDLIDEWHDGGGFGVPLHEYLGMTRTEYMRWLVQR